MKLGLTKHLCSAASARVAAVTLLLAGLTHASAALATAQAPPADPAPVVGAQGGSPQSPTYRVYVANESSDLVSRVAFTPGEGAVVEREIPVGVMPGDNDGAHGISVSPDGRHWYVTIAHGTPRGHVWKFHAGPDTLVSRTTLGLFPATMGITPDGQFLLAANFNLHGDMAPSDVSVVYTPDMIEVTRVRTCAMPHGSRLSADGALHYSACMHSERLVEIDVESFQVSRMLDVSPGGSGVCSPTWVEPGLGPRADRFVYVACNRHDELLEVDVASWGVTRRFATGSGPYNLEATADGSRLIVTLKGEQAVAVIDLATGDELAHIATSRPVTHGVAASPDGRYAFVSNESIGSVRGTLDIVDLGTLQLVETIELEHQSGGIDFWNGPGSPEG